MVVAGGEAASWLRAHLWLSHTPLHTFYFLPLSLSRFGSFLRLFLCVFPPFVSFSHTHSLSLPLSSWPPSCSFIINSSRFLQSLLFLGFTWPRRPCAARRHPTGSFTSAPLSHSRASLHFYRLLCQWAPPLKHMNEARLSFGEACLSFTLSGPQTVLKTSFYDTLLE